MCTILGVAPSTIRLYEKYLPAIPWDIEDNGYRGFYTENIMHLMDCRAMVKEGMSVQEAFDVSLARSVPAKEEALDRQHDRLTEQMRRLTDLLTAVDEQRALVAKISVLLDGYEVVDMPAFFHFPFFSYRLIPGLHDLVSQWAGAIPFVSYATHYALADYLAGKCPIEKTGGGGFIVPLRFSHLVATGSPHVQLVPAQRCVAAVIAVQGVPRLAGSEKFSDGLPRNEEVFRRTVQRMGDCLAQEGCALRGNIYMRVIHAEYPAILPGEDRAEAGCCYSYVWTPLIEEGPAL